jgi:hypothetical protein
MVSQQQFLDKIAKIIGDKVSDKTTTNKDKAREFATKIGNATSSEQIKKIVLDENPNASHKQLDKLCIKVFANKKRVTFFKTYKSMVSISMLTELAFGGMIDNKWSIKIYYMKKSYFANK